MSHYSIGHIYLVRELTKTNIPWDVVENILQRTGPLPLDDFHIIVVNNETEIRIPCTEECTLAEVMIKYKTKIGGKIIWSAKQNLKSEEFLDVFSKLKDYGFNKGDKITAVNYSEANIKKIHYPTPIIVNNNKFRSKNRADAKNCADAKFRAKSRTKNRADAKNCADAKFSAKSRTDAKNRSKNCPTMEDYSYLLQPNHKNMTESIEYPLDVNQDISI